MFSNLFRLTKIKASNLHNFKAETCLWESKSYRPDKNKYLNVKIKDDLDTLGKINANPLVFLFPSFLPVFLLVNLTCPNWP